MNRNDRRNFAKKLKRLSKQPKPPGILKPGDKVKLNVDLIKSHEDYKKGVNPKYAEWIEENKDSIFTLIDTSKVLPLLLAWRLHDGKEEVHWIFREFQLIKVDEADEI